MGGTRLRPVGEGGHIIEDEGVPLAQQPALNFLGAGVTAADAPGKTNVTIPGGGGGAASVLTLLSTTNLGGSADVLISGINEPVTGFQELILFVEFSDSFAGGSICQIQINGEIAGYVNLRNKALVGTATPTITSENGTASSINFDEFCNEGQLINLELRIKGVTRFGGDWQGTLVAHGNTKAGGGADEVISLQSWAFPVDLGSGTTINTIRLFTGTAKVFDGGSTAKLYKLDVTAGAGGGGGHVIEDEGTPLAQQADLNFVGTGVTAADAGGKTVVTIPGLTSTADVHVEKIAEVTQALTGIDLTASFTARLLSDYSHFVCQFAGVGVSGDNLGWAINAIFAGYKDSGNNTGGFVDAGDYQSSGPIYSVCQINGYAGFDPTATKKTMMLVSSYNDNAVAANLVDTIAGALTTPTQTQLTSVTVRSATETIIAGSKLTIWGYKLTPVGIVGHGNAHVIEDEGVPLAQRTKLNFVGAGVTVTDDLGDDATVVTILAGGGGHVIEDEGTPVAQRANLNFKGIGVTVTDNDPDTDVDIPGYGSIIGSVIAPGGSSSVNIILTETIPFDGTVAEIELVGTLSVSPNPDSIQVTINNDVGAVYDTTLVKVNTSGVVTGSHVAAATSWGSGETVAIGGFMSMIKIIFGIGGNLGGDRPAIEFFETCGGPPPPSTVVYREGRGIHVGSVASITSIQVKTAGGNDFIAGSQFTVFKRQG